MNAISFPGNSLNRHLCGHRGSGAKTICFVSGSTASPNSGCEGCFKDTHTELPQTSAKEIEVRETSANGLFSPQSSRNFSN